MGAAQPLQQAVFVTVFDLRGTEFDVQQVLAEGAGECFLKELEVKFRFFLLHQTDRQIQGGDDLLSGVDVAAVNAADVVLVRFETFFDLTDFFLVHIYFEVPFFPFFVQSCVIMREAELRR